MNRDIELLVTEFVGKLDKVFAKQAAEKMTDLLETITNGNGKGKKAISRRGLLVAGKRSPEDLEKTQTEIIACLVRNPEGLRCEELAKKMGTTTDDLALPLRKLGNKLKTKGVARGRRYWAK